jgi:hypothetical protein
MRKAAQKLPSLDTRDPEYRRLKYCRYADDFVVAFTGPKAEAEAIKKHLHIFLHEELRLTLSHEKTLITHAKTQAAKFLGYEIVTLHNNRKRSKRTNSSKKNTKCRSINGNIGLRVPQTVLHEKGQRYLRHGKPIHRAELINDSDFTIIATYQLEYRGLVNYYKMAFNLGTLSYLKWVMEQSLVKTLAGKHKTSVRQIYEKYRVYLNNEGKVYKGLQVTIPREGKPSLVATWGGIPLTWDIQATLQDQRKLTLGWRSELEQRLLAQVCERCGATRITDKIEVHHIRALKDLEKYTGRETPLWVKKMAARRRKTLVLCRTCHEEIHAGHPIGGNKVSRSREQVYVH